jgi:hypothetical protein
MSRTLITCVCLTQWPKRREMLSDALHAYALQTHSPRRLLVLNDGKPLRALREDVQVVNWPVRLSVGEKRHRGLTLVGESWTATWDDDDFCMPWHLTELLRSAQSAQADMVRTASYVLADQNLAIGCIVNGSPYAGCLFWAPTARHLGGYPAINYAEDWALHAKFLWNRIRQTIAPTISYVVRKHVHNVTRGNDRHSVQDASRLRDGLYDQHRWPRPDIQALQQQLDYYRTLPVPELVAPV